MNQKRSEERTKMGKIYYPEWLNEGDLMAVTAPSSGIVDEPDVLRFKNGKAKLEKAGIKVEFGDTVFNYDGHGRSCEAAKRAEEFNRMVKDKNIKFISSACGGDYLCEILPLIDYEGIKANPTWFQGFSDNTGLCFSITTKTDVATIYGDNFGSYGMEEWHRSVEENVRIIKGETVKQQSFDMYEDERHEKITGLEGYFGDKNVNYKGFCGYNEVSEINLQGRMIGGCFDVIVDLSGTTYEDYKGFVNRHKDDGIILYLESFVANSETTVRWLWKLREMGWFEGINGIVFGRPTFESTESDTTYEEAVKTVLGPLGITYIMGADIGHKKPQFTVINGAKATISMKDGKGSILLSCD